MHYVKFVRKTFPSCMVARMTVAVMSQQIKYNVEIAKLKVENKHEVKMSAILFGREDEGPMLGDIEACLV